MRSIPGFLLATGRAIAFIVWIILVVPPKLLSELPKDTRMHEAMLKLVFKGVLRIMGIRVMTTGGVPAQRPALLVSNHASYSDIFVMGSLLPMRYTPKREAQSWPIIGFLIDRSRPLYIDRNDRSRIRAQQQEMQDILKAGDNILLFPEGTTSNGNQVLPFKSSLLSAAEYHDAQGSLVNIQPITLAYTGTHGRAATADERTLVAWYDDMALLPHIWRMFHIPRTTITVHYHSPVTMAQFASRKELASACEATIRGTHEALIGSGNT